MKRFSLLKSLIIGILLLPKIVLANTYYQLEKDVVSGSIVNFYVVEVINGTSTRVSGALNLPAHSNDFEPVVFLQNQNKFIIRTDKYSNDDNIYEASYDLSSDTWSSVTVSSKYNSYYNASTTTFSSVISNASIDNVQIGLTNDNEIDTKKN